VLRGLGAVKLTQQWPEALRRRAITDNNEATGSVSTWRASTWRLLSNVIASGGGRLIDIWQASGRRWHGHQMEIITGKLMAAFSLTVE
jgi:hypothetical protein